MSNGMEKMTLSITLFLFFIVRKKASVNNLVSYDIVLVLNFMYRICIQITPRVRRGQNMKIDFFVMTRIN